MKIFFRITRKLLTPNFRSVILLLTNSTPEKATVVRSKNPGFN